MNNRESCLWKTCLTLGIVVPWWCKHLVELIAKISIYPDDIMRKYVVFWVHFPLVIPKFSITFPLQTSSSQVRLLNSALICLESKSSLYIFNLPHYNFTTCELSYLSTPYLTEAKVNTCESIFAFSDHNRKKIMTLC